MASNLAPAELFNPAYGKSRINTFLEKYRKGEPFTLVSTTRRVRMVFEDEKYKILRSVTSPNDPRLKNFTLRSTTGKEYYLSSFAKTAEFGGAPAGKPISLKLEKNAGKENIGSHYFIESEKISTPTRFKTTEYGERDIINTINSQVPKDGVLSLKIKNKTFNIIGAAKITKDVKADIALIDENKEAICFISHKLPTFSSYGGISELTQNKTIISFAEGIATILEERQQTNARGFYGTAGDSFYAEIPNSDINIILKTVYGKNFTPNGIPGVYNVNYVIEGAATIDAQGKLHAKIYSPSNNNWLLNGSTKAILFARFDRSAGRGLTVNKNGERIRIDNLRFSIAPITVVRATTSEKIDLTN